MSWRVWKPHKYLSSRWPVPSFVRHESHTQGEDDVFKQTWPWKKGPREFPVFFILFLAKTNTACNSQTRNFKFCWCLSFLDSFSAASFNWVQLSAGLRVSHSPLKDWALWLSHVKINRSYIESESVSQWDYYVSLCWFIFMSRCVSHKHKNLCHLWCGKYKFSCR